MSQTSPSVTLRDLLGLSGRPAALTDSALVMIDCQNTYRQGVMRLEGVEEALAEAAHLLRRARDLGVPVFHVMHDAGKGTPYDITAPIGHIMDEVVPRSGEPVVIKTHPSSFFRTDLRDRLRTTGLTDLVLAGFMTHMCVDSTARDAFDLGYRPTVVAAATATRELVAPDGTVVAAGALQTAALTGIADLFALVVEKADEIPG
ncbi:nicotinamidase-related amidase [Streptomyces sp. SAI-126]|jgi:nicotinamidase-related amidase|uniref:cysteine hydrolase family protein n=1 Tax=unclassified Streptomyces TaxID=2593676 RepID=UPI000F504092|nr:cysteine hydrolase family protein [Streptomyces sp. A2-16]QUC59999.1 cysteine hydrolase [Streptomyces sp. A2-16]